MELDRLAVELRRRNGFESLDLGLAMLHAWRWPVLRAWCATYWPFALLVSGMFYAHPAVAGIIVWWSKPAFDRVLLHVFAAAMFDAPPTVRDTLRALPRLIAHSRLFIGLTVMRLGMARSLYLPVAQLEGQRGAAARARRRVLGARGYGYAAWLTFFCANLVGVWAIGAALVLLALMPVDTLQGFSLTDLFTYEAEWIAVAHCVNFVVFIVDSFVEPYFVAAGFSLYLNRRSELEGWDLEVAFRRMARRRSGGDASTPALATSVVALCTLLVLAAPGDVRAANETLPAPAMHATDKLPFPAGAIKHETVNVLADPVFGRKEMRTRWVARQSPDAADRRWPWLEAWLNRVGRVMDAIARVGRVAVWLASIIALGAAVYVLLRYRERWLRTRPARAVPQTLFGLDVRPQSLPADVAGMARAAIAAGDLVGALSLLYRGALFALVNFAAVDFRVGDTERDCWRRAKPVLSVEGAGYFRRLLDAWLRAAYARQAPPRDDVARLCDEWSRHFARGAFDTGHAA